MRSTQGPHLFSPRNPSVQHTKSVSSTHPSVEHQKTINSTLWGVSSTSNKPAVQHQKSWSGGYLVLNWRVCWAGAFYVLNWRICFEMTVFFCLKLADFEGWKGVALLCWTDGCGTAVDPCEIVFSEFSFGWFRFLNGVNYAIKRSSPFLTSRDVEFLKIAKVTLQECEDKISETINRDFQ